MTTNQLTLLVAYLDARRDTARAETHRMDGGDDTHYTEARLAQWNAYKTLEAACSDFTPSPIPTS